MSPDPPGMLAAYARSFLGAHGGNTSTALDDWQGEAILLAVHLIFRMKKNTLTLSCVLEHFRGCDFDGVEVRCIYNSTKCYRMHHYYLNRNKEFVSCLYLQILYT